MTSKRPGWEVWKSAFELSGKGTPYLHLERANTRGICHCTCERALVAAPSQLGCPWCGCGWLFCCMMCGKAFTYAKPVLIDYPLRELVERDLLARGWKRDDEWFESETAYLADLMSDIEEGCEYVYLDGVIFPLDTREIEFDGLHSHHRFATLPHADELENPGALDAAIGDAAYWEARRLPPQDDEEQ